MPNPPRPQRLYKYQPFTTHALENIKNRQIWFSAPVAFNDPFDCATVVCAADITPDEWQHLAEHFKQALQAQGKPVPPQLTEPGLVGEILREHVANRTRMAIAQHITTHREQRGVACFAERNDDLLMWAHYADGHRGFCLEFDFTDDEFRNFRKVAYRSSAPILRVPQLLLESDADLFEAFLLTKHTTWSYEREWRGVHREPNKLYNVGWKRLTGVYFGAAMPAVRKEILCLMLHGSPTKLYSMQRREGHYELTAEGPLTYTPFPYDD